MGRSSSLLRWNPFADALASAAVLAIATGASARTAARMETSGQAAPPATVRWSTPRRVLAGPTILFRSPSLAASSSAAYVVAGPPLQSGGRHPTAHARDGRGLVVERIGGTSPGQPPGAFVFVHPRAALAADGTLHLVWAEPSNRMEWDTTAEKRSVRLGSLWYSRLRGRQWSAPVKIYEAGWIAWEPVATSALVITPSGVLHLAFPDEDRGGGPGITHMSRVGSRWNAVRLRTRAPPVYADLAVGPGARVSVAYVAGYRESSESHENALFVVQSTNDGAAWKPEHLVGGASRWPAAEPRLLVGRGGDLHVIWTSHAPGQLAGQGMWHAASADGGATWNRFARLPFAGVTSQNQAVIDRRGVVHLVFTAYRNRRADLFYATYEAGRWTSAVPLFPSRMGAQPSMRADAAGRRIYMAWVAQPAGVTVPVQATRDTVPWFEIAYSTAEVTP